MEDINRIGWLMKLILKLMTDKFDGTLMIDFQRGFPNKKYRQQSVGYGEEFENV